MSRRIVRSCSGFGIASVARRKTRRNRSSVSSVSFCSSSSVFSSRSAPGFSLAILALLPSHELRLDRQLGRRQRQRLARQILGDALHFEHHAARLHHRHPSLGVPLPLPHSCLGGHSCDRLVGDEPDPYFLAVLLPPSP